LGALSICRGRVAGGIAPQNHDSRGPGQGTQPFAQIHEAVLAEIGEDAHHEIGAIDLRGPFLRLLRDGVYFHRSILYGFSSLRFMRR
jgi:hypothetical protein